jgi:hypothetical protein
MSDLYPVLLNNFFYSAQIRIIRGIRVPSIKQIKIQNAKFKVAFSIPIP